MSTPKQETIKADLEQHPELTPILDTDRDGNIVCIGWTSPIYTFNKDFLELLEESDGTEPKPTQ
jgi:hypothetical protein